MLKTLYISICLVVTFNTFSQKILYSNNSLYSKIKYEYYIVGKVNNNILIWQTDAKNYTSLIYTTDGEYNAPQTEGGRRYSSKIFIYNSSMQLINTVSSNILESSIDIQPYFFTSQNCFRIIFSSLNGDTLLHKMASFDANGNLKSVDTLYSGKVKKEDVLKSDNGYFILQSGDKKTACFIKAIYDKNTYNLKFMYSFIDDTVVSRSFSFSIDITKKQLASLNIDNNKNLLLMFEEKKGDSCIIEIMRKDFANNLMLVADKTLRANGFKMYSAHIEQNATGYIFFGEVDNNRNENLFVWQTTNTLDDIAADTILNKKLEGIQNFIPSSGNGSNTFLVWNDDINYVQTQKNEYNFFRRNSYTGAFSNNNTSFVLKVPVKSVELFQLDSFNSISWSKKFDNSPPGKTSINLSNFSLIKANNNLHVIYEGRINNNPRFLNHMVISTDGTMSEKYFTTWDTKYNYILDRGRLIDDNTLIVPAVKFNLIRFAKIVLE